MTRKDNDLLSGLENFEGSLDIKDSPQKSLDQKIEGYHNEIAKGTIQVLSIKLPDGTLPTVLIKHISLDNSGALSVDFVSTSTEHSEELLWPYVKEALSLQIDIITKEKVSVFKKLMLRIKKLWKKQ